VLRLPAVAGRFYPSNPDELSAIVRQCVRVAAPSENSPQQPAIAVKACLLPHAGYVYSGAVAGAVFSRLVLPRKILILGVRHAARGQQAAILSSGAWRTPLGDVPIEEGLARELMAACPLLREDDVAHSAEHSLEVQLPFLQVLVPGLCFVPVALGTLRFEDLVLVGEAVGQVIAAAARLREQILLLATSDMNHYEDDATTRVKDRKAIERLLELDARGLYDTCRNGEISMCGLGPAVAMISALQGMGGARAELVKYATSGDVSGNTSAVVGYAGMIFA
jgi:MEMO1 family protein